MASNGAPVPEHPSLDVAAALAPPAGTTSDEQKLPFTPLVGLQGAPGVTPGALPLLVRMPDGERRQIELPPTATVRDLRDQMPGDSNWEFNFNGQQMSDASTLAAYNIPDAYGHAGGLLKMITGSGDLDNTQKAELLKSACNVVHHISRGETDMERLISAAFDDAGGENNRPGSPTQPSLQSIRRGKRSFPSLNLTNLPQPGRPSAGPGAPPTPSQLIQKLSASRPDIYLPTAASRMLDDVGNNPSLSLGKLDAHLPSPAPKDANSGALPEPYNVHSNISFDANANGEFKRVNTNTWFSEFAKNIAPLGDENERDADKTRALPLNQNASIGDSEDEEPAAPLPGSTEEPTGVFKKPGEQAGPEAAPQDSHEVVPGKQENSLSSRACSAERSLPPNVAKDVNATASGASSSSVVKNAASEVPQPKKRGRKRKNPELSEEERKALRQAQNRASAKLSRLRRKEMAKEYQERVSTLEGENEHLRDTVAALSDRLQFLQNLLTVSVQKRPSGPGPRM